MDVTRTREAFAASRHAGAAPAVRLPAAPARRRSVNVLDVTTALEYVLGTAVDRGPGNGCCPTARSLLRSRRGRGTRRVARRRASHRWPRRRRRPGRRYLPVTL